jgi:hypothetical protein
MSPGVHETGWWSTLVMFHALTTATEEEDSKPLKTGAERLWLKGWKKNEERKGEKVDFERSLEEPSNLSVLDRFHSWLLSFNGLGLTGQMDFTVRVRLVGS